VAEASGTCACHHYVRRGKHVNGVAYGQTYQYG
jgi:hypothetical protein